MDIPYELPSFREDPALYDDDVTVYIQMLSELGCYTALASTRKPSLSEYDDAIE